MTRPVPDYRALPPAPAGGRSAWSYFGEGDNLGRIGLQDAEGVREAAALVRTGTVFALNAPHTLVDPPLFARGAVRHTVLGQIDKVGFDDVYDNYYPQACSQWDSLAHIAYTHDVYYQGLSADDIVGQRRNTIEHWAQRGIVGRGVLLDVTADVGVDEVGTSRAITVDELEAARVRAGIEYRTGDVVLLHTGFLRWYAEQPRVKRKELARLEELRAVGIEHSEAMAEYLWNSGAAAWASDSPALEVWPPDRSPETVPFGFLHQMLIAQLGVAIGELWWLADLAEDCLRDGRHEFLLTSAPVNMPGGMGSPANALALK